MDASRDTPTPTHCPRPLGQAVPLGRRSPASRLTLDGREAVGRRQSATASGASATAPVPGRYSAVVEIVEAAGAASFVGTAGPLNAALAVLGAGRGAAGLSRVLALMARGSFGTAPASRKCRTASATWAGRWTVSKRAYRLSSGMVRPPGVSEMKSCRIRRSGAVSGSHTRSSICWAAGPATWAFHSLDRLHHIGDTRRDAPPGSASAPRVLSRPR